MKFHTKKTAYFEARIYIGSRVKYDGPQFSFAELREAIGYFQANNGIESNPVRITPTTFVWEKYDEEGWEIALIDYPRVSKPHEVLRKFAYNLAVHLLERFEQNRMSIVFPDEIVMLEADDAEENKYKSNE
jgi:hypothetical protein